MKTMPLSMIDDILGFALCGIESTKLNTFINCKGEMFKLGFSHPKCKQIHVGTPCPYCPTLQVHGEEFEKSDAEKYLGDIISNTVENCNNRNIKSRKGKGIGITAHIMTIMNNVSLGMFYFEIAAVLRESLLINGMLFNTESWYGVTSDHTKELEKVDKLLLRRIFNTPFSTPTESLYLELGVIPLRYVIIGRRLMYLHYLLNLDEHEMLSKFFQAQLNQPGKNDWTETIQKDLLEMKINMSFHEIQQISYDEFKIVVKEKYTAVAFKSLMGEKNCHSKLGNLSYAKLEMQAYLRDGILNYKEARLVFSFRTRMIDVGCNYKNKGSLLCPLCRGACDDQKHLLNCPKIHTKEIPNVNYDDIFGDDTSKMKAVLRELSDAMQIRDELLKVGKEQ